MKLDKQIESLNQQFDKGTISLDSYVKQLARLENEKEKIIAQVEKEQKAQEKLDNSIESSENKLSSLEKQLIRNRVAMENGRNAVSRFITSDEEFARITERLP